MGGGFGDFVCTFVEEEFDVARGPVDLKVNYTTFARFTFSFGFLKSPWILDLVLSGVE